MCRAWARTAPLLARSSPLAACGTPKTITSGAENPRPIRARSAAPCSPAATSGSRRPSSRRGIRVTRTTTVRRDGLSDAWETVVLERFPAADRARQTRRRTRGLEVPPASPRASFTSRRKIPRTSSCSSPSHGRDYGSCGLTEHHGDVERAVLGLTCACLAPPGDATIVRGIHRLARG